MEPGDSNEYTKKSEDKSTIRLESWTLKGRKEAEEENNDTQEKV
tara:strand:+ start:513 stop:644 length:132 start_codon:yes stop_codon:yes gene_type:complete